MYGKTSVIVRRTVGPPHWAAFAECAFRRICLEACSYSPDRVLSISYGAFRCHEFIDEPSVRGLIQSRITQPPKTSQYDVVATVGCWRVIGSV
jgi:hypothetical protein